MWCVVHAARMEYTSFMYSVYIAYVLRHLCFSTFFFPTRRANLHRPLLYTVLIGHLYTVLICHFIYSFNRPLLCTVLIGHFYIQFYRLPARWHCSVAPTILFLVPTPMLLADRGPKPHFGFAVLGLVLWAGVLCTCKAMGLDGDWRHARQLLRHEWRPQQTTGHSPQITEPQPYTPKSWTLDAKT